MPAPTLLNKPLLTATAVIRTPGPAKLPNPAHEAWDSLGLSQKQNWRRYAQSLRRYDSKRDKVVGPSAKTVFTQLAKRARQLDPSLSAPLTPPAGAFEGDYIGVLVARTKDQEKAPQGAIRVFSTGENQEGILTEILIQRLRPGNEEVRSSKWRSIAFVSFESGQTHSDLEVARGIYAVAYRFVKIETLQTSSLCEAGRVGVGARRVKKVNVAEPKLTTGALRRRLSTAERAGSPTRISHFAAVYQLD